jgi:hypothetical protein
MVGITTGDFAGNATMLPLGNYSATGAFSSVAAGRCVTRFLYNKPSISKGGAQGHSVNEHAQSHPAWIFNWLLGNLHVLNLLLIKTLKAAWHSYPDCFQQCLEAPQC